MTDEKEPEFERLQTIEERKIFDEAIRCILCACCSASCPVTETSEDFTGPAALLRSFRYLFDSRDKADKERIAMIDTPDGAHGCKAHGKCTEVCPKEIQVAKAIGKTKKKIYDFKKQKKS
jgi:succinate dehydrogenase / fumarate reductase iron-sulfur subunit